MNMTILFEGCIGVGKSTTAKYFSEHFRVPYEEEKIDTPLLGDFYKNPERWSFALQIHFLNTRFRDIKTVYHNSRGCLDRAIYIDRLFAKVNMEMGRMTKEEFELYDDLFDNMMEDLNEGLPSKHPDLLIFLQADFDVVYSRMVGRARPEEMDSLQENYEYFKYLHSRYEEYILTEYVASDVLVVDTNNLNIHDEGQRLELFSTIETLLHEMGI